MEKQRDWPQTALNALDDAWVRRSSLPGYVERGLRDDVCQRIRSELTRGTFARCEVPVQLSDWPGVGPFDIAVADSPDDRLLCVFETKWAKRPSTANEALWDAAKLAVAAAVGRTAEAYLLYAGPTSSFTSSGVAGELFRGGTWLLPELIYRYPSWWNWPVKTRPDRLPRRFDTPPAGDAAWQGAAGTLWEARCLRIVSPEDGWVPVVGGWPQPPQREKD